MNGFIDKYMVIIIVILFILSAILPYICYNAFLVVSGALLLCILYYFILTMLIKPIREYMKIQQDITNFKNKHNFNK